MAKGIPTLKFKLLNKTAKLPTYAHTDDAGFDLYSTEEKVLKPGKVEIVPLGIASEIPVGWYVEIRDRSGMAVNYGIHSLAGTIDAGYRGEWKIVLVNHGAKRYKIERRERIAQGVLQLAPQAKIVEVKNLSDSKRGKGGFGSTGRK